MERTELGRVPISPEKPAGEDIKYEAEFEELQGEIDKLTAVTGGIPDWGKVVRLAEEILGTRSKDLKVASYLCAGLLHTEGLGGLSQGLAVLKDMLSNFWEGMYPPKKRIRGRIGALSWLFERLEHSLEGFDVRDEEAAGARACREALDGIEKEMEGLLGDKAPTVRPLMRLLERWPEPARAPEGPQAVEQEAGGAAAARPSRERPRASLDELADIADVQKALKDQLQVTRRIAGLLQSQEPRSPVPYHVLLQSIWSTIENAPPSQEGRTRVPAPPEALVSRLKAMEERGAWEELLKDALARLPEMPLWLDLARMVWVALSSRGTDWERAAQAVQQEVRILVERIPSLPDLSFADGTPIASPLVREWIRDKVLGGPRADEQPSRPREEEGREALPCDGTIRKAEDMALSGDLRGALDLLSASSLKASSQEEAFRYQLAMARLCLDADRYNLAQPILASLAQDVERFHLEVWQPGLAAQAIYQYYLCEQGIMKKQRPTPEQRERTRELYSKLCRLDPVTALGLA